MDIGLTQGPSWVTKRDEFDLVGSGGNDGERTEGPPSSGIGARRDTGTQGRKGVGEWVVDMVVRLEPRVEQGRK